MSEKFVNGADAVAVDRLTFTSCQIERLRENGLDLSSLSLHIDCLENQEYLLLDTPFMNSVQADFLHRLI